MKRVFIPYLIILVAGCSLIAQTDVSPSVAYRDAIRAAAVVTPEKVQPLTPVSGGDAVLVVSWVSPAGAKASCSIPPGQSSCQFTRSSDSVPRETPVWVVLHDELRSKCGAWQLHDFALQQRMEQLLGLPLNQPEPFRKTEFLIMRVSPSALYRPCVGEDDSDPSHPSCLVRMDAAVHPQPEWLSAFVSQYSVWAYVLPESGAPGYPFTRLGYTYDWHLPPSEKGNYGVSEFIISLNTPITVIGTETTDAFCDLGQKRITNAF